MHLLDSEGRANSRTGLSRSARAASLVAATLLAVALLSACSAKPSQDAPAPPAQGASAPSAGKAASLASFSTVTLSGDPFTQEKFAGYDLTMINIWSTGCGFCIEEMPALEVLHQSLPENVNMISICADARLNSDAARAIVKAQGVTFDVLADSPDLNEALLSDIPGTPTTVFVDSKGNFVGEPQLGVPARGPVDAVVSAYGKIIESRLAELG